MTSRARIAAITAAVAGIATAAAPAATGMRDTADAPPLAQQALTSGALSMSDSRDGRAIFSASELAPGGSATGTVTIRNTGSVAGSLGLAPGVPATSGPRGHALLRALRLRIADVTTPVERAVYSGGLDAMPALALSRLEPGSARSYEFSALLPDGGASPDGAGDNLLQRASISVAYDWTLTQASEPPPVTQAASRPPAVDPPAGGGPPAPARRCPRHLLGSARNNRLVGTRGGDRIYGKAGADAISGRGGIDCLWGGAGKDDIRGGAGDDRLHGGTGGDVLSGGSGRDDISGGFGSDLIDARDGGDDVIDCGPGRDRAVVDRRDRTRHCERVLRPARRR